MWHNHSFSQQNKATEREMGVGIGDDREGEGWTKFEKKGGLGNIWGVVHNIWGFRTPLPTMALQKRFIK